jgi:hypothetical protein
MGGSNLIRKKYAYVVGFERTIAHVVNPQHPIMTDDYKHVGGDISISYDGKSCHIIYQYHILFGDVA